MNYVSFVSVIQVYVYTVILKRLYNDKRSLCEIDLRALNKQLTAAAQYVKQFIALVAMPCLQLLRGALVVLMRIFKAFGFYQYFVQAHVSVQKIIMLAACIR